MYRGPSHPSHWHPNYVIGSCQFQEGFLCGRELFAHLATCQQSYRPAHSCPSSNEFHKALNASLRQQQPSTSCVLSFEVGREKFFPLIFQHRPAKVELFRIEAHILCCLHGNTIRKGERRRVKNCNQNRTCRQTRTCRQLSTCSCAILTRLPQSLGFSWVPGEAVSRWLKTNVALPLWKEHLKQSRATTRNQTFRHQHSPAWQRILQAPFRRDVLLHSCVIRSRRLLV